MGDFGAIPVFGLLGSPCCVSGEPSKPCELGLSLEMNPRQALINPASSLLVFSLVLSSPFPHTPLLYQRLESSRAEIQSLEAKIHFLLVTV